MTVRRLLLRLLLLPLLAAPLAATALTEAPRPAAAEEVMRAAAVVNDEIVSQLDLEMRLRIAMAGAGVKDTPETRQRLLRPVMRQLIDERLEMQEAKRLGISVPDEAVDDAFTRIAKNNRMAPEQFAEVMKKAGILPEALKQQVRAALTWRAVIDRRIRPKIQVGEDEVTDLLARLKEGEGQEVVRVAEIFLSFDNADQEAEVRSTAERLIEQIRQGATFSEVARQFSQAATASVGGDLGWLLQKELAPEVAAQVAKMKPGEMVGPIRSVSGYYIVLLRDRRKGGEGSGETRLRLSRIAIPVQPGQEQAAVAEAARQTKNIQSCAQADAIAAKVGGQTSESAGDLTMEQIPASVRDLVSKLPIGQPSQPIVANGAANVLVVCLREQKDGLGRDQITERLTQQKVELETQRYLRDLRRAANIDIRV
ncbi:periplasmic chaperone for outer membrane proteins SurA [Tistlia consotensis]|uniref:Parvulin-like PPIase n=1 Tax=Tistlia consotensis USBA 355 TaxID=560819 RepID=A0A1Y6CRR5_9PROT|nr:peptidylprolyl isomerase [Tistlia consotensis]SMF83366.1 periplasmic chaperone for outer membrane proteins SurA [Tistlia consotensis USBA 355]SNS32734.1 periplasmic chaperone for outer membrane proteins SurA [Tistlia consotensis]